MRSPRTESPHPPPPVGARLLRTLDARFVVALAAMALIGLLVAGLALNQILPAYFAEQADRRMDSAAISTELLIVSTAEETRRSNPALLQVPENRSRMLQAMAQVAADGFAQATVEVYQAGDRVRVAHAMPRNTSRLLEQGLRPDPAVAPVEIGIEIDITISQPPATSPDSTILPLIVRISEPFTSREASLDRLRGALLAAGVLALIVSFIVGLLAARRLVVPLRRLQRASERLTTGELDERVPGSGVVEIDELGTQFNTMADHLRESLTMLAADRDRLREFVADVSHELRTPIAALRTFVDLQRDGELDPETRREFLARSSEQIQRLEWLSSNLLDLSRIDAGIYPLDVQVGDLRDPVRSVVEAHAEAVEARGVSLSSRVPSSPVQLAFDRERIVQLVNNLVGNALKFTQPGGAVMVAISEPPDEVWLEVQDTGPGIEPGELPRIFERFYRGTNTGDARASGSGLGLAIARSIAEMHGGTIEVETVPGEGATFRLRLPRSRSMPGGPEAEEIARPARAPRRAALTGRLTRRARDVSRGGGHAADAVREDQ